MAGRILNRRVLREQVERAGQLGASAATAENTATALPKKRVRVKAAAAPRPRKPRKVKVPPRMRARWGVFDSAMKQVAIFDYNQRAAADDKLADLRATKKGVHFMQIVKEPMPEPVLAEVATLPG